MLMRPKWINQILTRSVHELNTLRNPPAVAARSVAIILPNWGSHFFWFPRKFFWRNKSTRQPLISFLLAKIMTTDVFFSITNEANQPRQTVPCKTSIGDVSPWRNELEGPSCPATLYTGKFYKIIKESQTKQNILTQQPDRMAADHSSTNLIETLLTNHNWTHNNKARHHIRHHTESATS